MTRLFAEHGSDAFNAMMERQVAAIAEDVRAALGDNLVALVLGGGYARGEGGVVRLGEEERAYNDLDFTLVVRRRDGVPQPALREISKRHEKVLHIDVDFSRPLTVEDIRRWPHWLMWTDLLAGHRVVAGDPNVLTANAPAVLRDSPPLIEATRLMLNRGAGLLWSLRIRRGCEPAPDADFVRRNVHKAALAMGDAVIMRHRRHQTRYGGRDAILSDLEKSDAEARAFALGDAYRAALAFRLEPGPAQPETFSTAELEDTAVQWSRVLVYTESARTGQRFSDVRDYVAWSGSREPELSAPACWPKNLVRNARLGRMSLAYPREVLYRVIPRLLTAPPADAAAFARESAAALSLWRRYN